MFYQPRHDDKGADQCGQYEWKEDRCPGWTRTSKLGQVQDDHRIDQCEQQDDTSYSAPQNSPSDANRFPVGRFHEQPPHPIHGERGLGDGDGCGGCGVGAGGSGPGIGSVG